MWAQRCGDGYAVVTGEAGHQMRFLASPSDVHSRSFKSFKVHVTPMMRILGITGCLPRDGDRPKHLNSPFLVSSSPPTGQWYQDEDMEAQGLGICPKVDR